MTDIAVCQDLARPRPPGGEGRHALARRRPGPAIPVPPDCGEMIRRGALVAVSSSGGKDSQCMTILLSRIAPREQMVVVHAPLAEVEWPGTIEHIENTLPESVPLILAPVTSGKSLLDSIEERGRFPSASIRWCTSSTKRSPIERELRRYLSVVRRGILTPYWGLSASKIDPSGFVLLNTPCCLDRRGGGDGGCGDDCADPSGSSGEGRSDQEGRPGVEGFEAHGAQGGWG